MHTPFGRVNIQSKVAMPSQLLDATLRDFSGGLNLIDEDTTIRSNFAKVLKNFHRDLDGTMSLRWGTMLKYDLTGTVTGNIIEKVYFNDKLVVFTSTGQIATVDANGVKAAIWNSTIAAALPGSPAGWSTGLVTIDTTEFKGSLVVCNGVDKPVIINSSFVANYLQDIPTGSNVFVPIGRYVTTVADYTVIGGVAATPFEIHISAKGTSGTWAGDPPPNDALSINIGAYAPSAGGDIRGISSFRNFLLVHFALQTVVVELGIYDDSGNHTPKPSDTIPDYGILSHRMSASIGSQLVFADERGVQKAKRNVFGGALEATGISSKLGTEFLTSSPSSASDRYKSFCILNKAESRIMFFLMRDGVRRIFVATVDETLQNVAWNEFIGMDFDCAAVTVRNRVYFSKGLKIYQYGNSAFAGEDYVGDQVADFDATWVTATAYVVGQRLKNGSEFFIVRKDHNSTTIADDLLLGNIEAYKGYPIDFDWELPWSDINTRMRKKRVRYIGMDTKGKAAFTIQCFVDNYYKDAGGNYDPAIKMDFVAGDSPGYGGGDQPYGGGRRAIDERLWGYPVEFKLFKVRICGSSIGRLKFSTFTILYNRGNYHR